MFVRHNAAQWQDPPDFGFEPSPVWLDDDVMASDPAARTFLMNILAQSKGSLNGLRRDVEAKRREVEGAKQVRQAIKEGRDKRDEVEVVRALFHNQESLHESQKRLISAEVEVSTITSAVGDISIGAQNHKFENKTFKIPTNCDLCGDRIWGLSAKGLSCGDCGFTCHLKCQMKVPADCPGELDKEAKKAAKNERQAAAQANATSPPPTANGENGGGGSGRMPSLQRSDTMGSMNTLSSGYAASAHRSVSGTTVTSPTESAPAAKPAPAAGRRRIVAPPPASYVKSDANGDGTSDEQRGKMMYAYQANGDGEISVSEGQEVVILEPDGMCLVPLNSDNKLTRHRRWFRLAESPSNLIWRNSGSGSGIIRRDHTQILPSIGRATTYVDRISIHNLTSRLYQQFSSKREESRPTSRTPQRREEDQARGGNVHLRP